MPSRFQSSAPEPTSNSPDARCRRGGKRIFDGFSTSFDLEHVGARQSPYATFIDYRVKR
jgi:hypothetical protein